MHPVIKYLETNDIKSLESLGIYARQSTRNPNKWSLNYDMIEAPNGNELVEHCRGLVISGNPEGSAGEWRVLAWPFRRFYNLGQLHAAVLDPLTTWFETKFDGTLCILYYDDTCGWSIATRSVPDADIPNNDGDTFTDLFWEYFDAENNWPDFNKDQKGLETTWLFELVGPGNHIGVVYNEWKVILLGMVDNKTGQTYPNEENRLEFKTIEEAKNWMDQQSGTDFEGFILVDAQGNRVKYKSANYLNAMKTITKVGSHVGMLSLILSGVEDDVIPLLPEVRKTEIYELKNHLQALIHKLTEFRNRIPVADRKTQALFLQANNLIGWIGFLLDNRDFHTWARSKHYQEDWKRSFIENLLRELDDKS